MAKIETFAFCRGYFSVTLWVKNLLETGLCLTVFEIFSVLFSTKIQDGCQKWQKLKFENFNYLNVAFICYKLTMWD